MGANTRGLGCVLLLSVVLVLSVVVVSAPAGIDRVVTPEEAAWLEQVRAEIERNGYDWVAGPTSVSHLTPEQRERLLGGEIPPEIQAMYDALVPDPAIENMRFRDSFDWRDYGGVTPAKSQGDCGACWAFGATGATEAQVKINEGVELDLSEQQAIDCNFQGSDCDGGWSGHAYQVHKDPGAVLEECIPYRAENGTSCRQGQCEKVAIIDGYQTVINTISSIKYAVENYGPISAGMHVYDDFFAYQGGCYEHAGSDPTDHVVLIVGWDDAMCGGEGAWICKNSWGRDWGENGFFYIKYGSCNIGSGAMRPVGAHVPKERYVPDEYATIQAAIDDARRGDIIKVAGGTYQENVTVSDYVSLYGGYDPTFTVRDPETYPVIIDANDAGHGISATNRDHIVIDGFVVENAGGTGSYAFYFNDSEVTVRNCEARDSWRGFGIVHGSASTDGDAVVEYCSSHDNAGAGIYVNSAVNPNVEIRYVAVYGNGAEGVYSYLSPTDIVNCTVALNGDDGIEIASSSGNIIKNSIVASNPGYGITCSGATVTITYNDVWGNSLGDYNGCSGGTGSISEDPIFCDAVGGDVSVHATSPTLDAGEGGVDMGALGIGCPAGPRNLSVVQVGAALELAWSPPPARADVDHYIVYRDTTQVPLTAIATVDAPDTVFSDITIPPCSQHNYWVSAVDTGDLEGAPSNKASGEICYAGPESLEVVFGDGANDLTWEPAEGAVDYYVVMRANMTSPADSIDFVTSPGTSYTDDTSDECPRDSYTYHVLPVYDTGWRGVASGTAGVDPVPAPPCGLSAGWSGSDIVLTWEPNCESDFRRYWVYRDTVPFSPPVNSELLVGTTSDTTFTDVAPNPDWTYFYRLTASDAADEKSDYSDMVWVGTGNVLTVPDPYPTIQAAIDAASAIDTVLVSPGTYAENIVLKDGVLVMSTDGRATTTIASSVSPVVSGVGLTDLTVLKGFTIDGLGSASKGLDCWDSYLRVQDCAIQNCTTGGSFQYGGSPTVVGNIFTGNQTGVSVADSSRPFFSANTFDGNSFTALSNSGDPGPEIGRTLADANDFLNVGTFHIFNMSEAEVDADYNWWGDLCPDPSWFYGPVDYVPWTDESHTGTYTECTGVSDDAGPARAFATRNFPNPFNPSTVIEYSVPAPGSFVRLAVYDLTGRRVRTLVSGHKAPGRHLAIWYGRDDAGRELASGVYFYRIEIGDYEARRKMVMLK